MNYVGGRNLNKPNIIYRDILRSDYVPLVDIIRKTWNYDRFCSPKTAKRLAKIYLTSCLANQTYIRVAENNGETVGIIMGKNIKTFKRNIRYSLMQYFAVAGIALSKEGRAVGKMFQDFDAIDDLLLKESGHTFGAELAFFAVRSDQQGTGIGKSLYEQFLAYIAKENIDSFYLYTDTTCNYGFYEHQGLEKLAEKNHSLQPYRDEEILFFLFGNVEKKLPAND